MDLPNSLLSQALAPYGIRLSQDQMESVREYIRLLVLWNQKINLTRIVKPEEMIARHFGESMFAVEKLGIRTGRLADVGTGAGFPGLAIKILCPDLEVSLIEANTKKAAFLSEVIRKLGLNGVTVLRKRLGELQLEQGSLEVVAARAVGDFSSLLSWSQRVLRPGGSVGLWLGMADVERLRKAFANWDWGQPIPIPNSERSFLLKGLKAR